MKIYILFLCVVLSACHVGKQAVGDSGRRVAGRSSAGDFDFVFMTDIHLQTEMGALTAFNKAIDTANRIKADFVLTGGDLVYDVLRGNVSRGDSLFRLYKETIRRFNKPVYNVIGNHDLFGIYPESDVTAKDPNYKYGMYERYLGPTYYSFQHKGWHFIVLNSIEEKDKKYIGNISAEQIAWLKKDLDSVDSRMPIALAMHIPLITVQPQYTVSNASTITEVPNDLWVANRNEVLDLFKQHNLKLVLQGHLHWVEDINVGGKVRFITGGAIAGRPSWRGTRNGEEGFLVIKIRGQEIGWDFIDYGWEARP